MSDPAGQHASVTVDDLDTKDWLGDAELAALLLDPGRPWDSGPFAEAARGLLTAHVAELRELAGVFDWMAEVAAGPSAGQVITHGGPHPATGWTQRP